MIFVSTSCMKGGDSMFEPSILRVLEVYQKLGIRNIELGAAHKPVDDAEEIFRKCKEIGENFTCHTNFPPTGDKRLLNICSQDKEMQELALSSAKGSLEFLNRLGGNLFSLHSGYTADISTELKPVTETVSHEKAIETGANILGQICDYAGEFDIKVAAENSPAGKFPVCSAPEKLKELLKLVSAKNLGILMDVGHATLTGQRLGIPMEEFVKLQDKILEFHAHNVVDGIDHQELKDSSIFNSFDKDVLKKAALTLESNGLNEKQILSSLEVIKSALQ